MEIKGILRNDALPRDDEPDLPKQAEAVEVRLAQACQAQTEVREEWEMSR